MYYYLCLERLVFFQVPQLLQHQRLLPLLQLYVGLQQARLLILQPLGLLLLLQALQLLRGDRASGKGAGCSAAHGVGEQAGASIYPKTERGIQAGRTCVWCRCAFRCQGSWKWQEEGLFGSGTTQGEQGSNAW